MKVGMKMLQISVGSLLILIVVSAFSYYSVTKLIETDRWVVHTQQVIEQMQQVLYLVTQAQTTARGHLFSGDGDDGVAENTVQGKLREVLKNVRMLTVDNPVQQKKLDQIEPLIDQAFAMMSKTVEIYDKEGYEAALQMVRTGKMQALVDRIRAMTFEMIDMEKGLLKKRVEEMSLSARNTELTILFGTVLAVVGVCLLGIKVTTEITTPIKILVRAAENMGRGRFDTITVASADDEIQDLAVAFNLLGINLQEKIDENEELRRETEGALALSAALRGQVERLAIRAEEFLSLARERTYEFEHYPETIAGIHSVAGELRDAAGGLTTLCRSITETAGQANDVRDGAIKGYSRLQEALTAFTEKVKVVATSVDDLAGRAEEMSDMSAAIDAIAAELSLIALTASMEAAKMGGPEGAPFSALAERLRAVTDVARADSVRVQQMLGRAEKAAGRAVAGFEDAQGLAEPVLREAGQLGGRLNHLDDMVRDINRNLAKLSDRSALHEGAHEQVNQRLEQLVDSIHRQGDYIKLAETKALELRELASHAEDVANAASDKPSHQALTI